MVRRHAAGGPALVLAASLAVAATLAVGCGPEPPSASSSLEEATVTGVVRVRGKPVNNGLVSFRSSNVNRPNAPTKEAPIGKDGTYSATTLVGANFVDVTCKELFQPQNQIFIENERMVTIHSGANTLDLDIPPASPPPAE